MASNKVGHFIYKLHDRVWPDFICRFHLFKSLAVNWESNAILPDEDDTLRANSVHRPMAIRPNLQVLKLNARGDSSASKELENFGFSRALITGQDNPIGRNLNTTFE